jgi:hypothetical protein
MSFRHAHYWLAGRFITLSSIALTRQIGSDRSNSGHAVDIAETQMTRSGH